MGTIDRTDLIIKNYVIEDKIETKIKNSEDYIYYYRDHNKVETLKSDFTKRIVYNYSYPIYEYNAFNELEVTYLFKNKYKKNFYNSITWELYNYYQTKFEFNPVTKIVYDY